LPGEPPNNDSFTLHNNIETALTADPLVVTVTSNAEHSTPLEFGTSKMAARPFMRPARDAKVKEAQALVAKAVNQIAKKGA